MFEGTDESHCASALLIHGSSNLILPPLVSLNGKLRGPERKIPTGFRSEEWIWPLVDTVYMYVYSDDSSYLISPLVELTDKGPYTVSIIGLVRDLASAPQE